MLSASTTNPEPLPCADCLGHGFTDAPRTACEPCRGTGHARCHLCNSLASVDDGDEQICQDCADAFEAADRRSQRASDWAAWAGVW
jgi:RecJ-like exonuclease